MQVLDFRVHGGGRCGGFPKLGVAKNRGYFFRGPYNRNGSIYGSM